MCWTVIRTLFVLYWSGYTGQKFERTRISRRSIVGADRLFRSYYWYLWRCIATFFFWIISNSRFEVCSTPSLFFHMHGNNDREFEWWKIIFLSNCLIKLVLLVYTAAEKYYVHICRWIEGMGKCYRSMRIYR